MSISLIAAAGDYTGTSWYRASREATGISRAAFAEQLGWPVSKLAAIEIGTKYPSTADINHMRSVGGPTFRSSLDVYEKYGDLGEVDTETERMKAKARARAKPDETTLGSCNVKPKYEQQHLPGIESPPSKVNEDIVTRVMSGAPQSRTHQSFLNYKRKEANHILKVDGWSGSSLADAPDLRERMVQRWKNMVDRSDVRIRINNGYFMETLRDGRFENQFSAGTSGGYYGPKVRSTAEARLFGIPDDVTNPDTHPVYGYLAEGVETGYSSARQYGDIVVHLRDDVRRRTTFTIGDSLGLEYLPSPVEDIDWASLVYDRRTAMGARKIQEAGIPYVEAQIHGGVSLDDIRLVEVPPLRDYLGDPRYRAQAAVERKYHDELVNALEELGIPWVQATA